MEIVAAVKHPKYPNKKERKVLIRIEDEDFGVFTYTAALREAYTRSSGRSEEVFSLYLDISDDTAAECFCTRPFMVIIHGQVQAIGASVTPDMLVEEVVPAFHSPNLVFDANAEVLVTGARKNDRGDCCFYTRCLAQANRFNKPNVCPPTCSSYYKEKVLCRSEYTTMEEP